MRLTGRAILRRKPLDEDCEMAYASIHEYGLDDNRIFCHGLYVHGGISAEIEEKCINCGAFVNNADYHVFTTEDGKNYQEITDALTVKDKEELIDDLIYCIQDLVRDK